MLNFTLKGLLSRDELQREKTKDYRNIVIVQIIIVVFGLTLSQPLLKDSKSDISKFIITLLPGSLGSPIELGLPNYAECVSYSLGILGGVDAGLQPTRLIRNISIIEAVWGSVYGMLIIGKLLGLPRQEEK